MLAKNIFLNSEWLNLNEELGVDKFQTILIQNKSSGGLYVWPRDTLPANATSGIYIKTGDYITINGGGESVYAKGSGEIYFQIVDSSSAENITLSSKNINLNEVWLNLNEELGVDKNQTLFVQNKSRGSLYLWPRDLIPDNPTAGTQLKVGDNITINGGGESVYVRGVGEIYVSVFLSTSNNGGGAGSIGPIDYNLLTNKPMLGTAAATDSTTYAPAIHAHVIADVTGLQTALNDKQAELISGTNIKTINGSSVLGAGDLVVGVTIDAVPTDGSTNAVSSNGVFDSLALKVQKSEWVDYSALSTIVGIGTFSEKRIMYKIIDDYIFVDFSIFGTSISTQFTFTVPFPSAEGFTIYRTTGLLQNQGIIVNNFGRSSIANGSNVVILRRDAAGMNDWTASSSKGTNGQIGFKI